MTSAVAALTGFLLAVLWFDLMFDVLVLPHRSAPEVPEHALESIAAYYHRVTITASPMGRLVGLAMFALLGVLVVQLVRDDAPVWVSVVSLAAAVFAIGLALGIVFGAARRLGTRIDPLELQSRLARRVFRGHVACLVAMLLLLALQLGAA